MQKYLPNNNQIYKIFWPWDIHGRFFDAMLTITINIMHSPISPIHWSHIDCSSPFHYVFIVQIGEAMNHLGHYVFTMARDEWGYEPPMSLCFHRCPRRFVVKIQVFPSPASYMLTPSRLSLLKWKAYSKESSETIGHLPHVLNLNWSSIKLNWLICK